LAAFIVTAVVVVAVVMVRAPDQDAANVDRGDDPGPVTSFADVAGTYIRRGPAAPTYLLLFEDGTIHTSTSVDRIADRPQTVLETRFDGTQVSMTTTSSMCEQPDRGGIYEVHVLANDNLQFVVVGEDTCELRSRVLRGHRDVPTVEYEPVTTTTGPTTPSPSSTIPAPVEVVGYVPYGEDTLAQNLDVYLPADGTPPYPTILAVHGGGFWARSKSDYAELGKHYAARGYALVAINYRLAPGAMYPAQVADAYCALAWLHAHANEYGFDGDQVVVTGGSAGGYLAAMLATVDDPSIFLSDCTHGALPDRAVHAAVIYYGLFDFTDISEYPSSAIEELEQFWGATHDEIPVQQLEEMSPIAHVDGDDPAFILLHGREDEAVLSSMSERFAVALEQAGVEVKLLLMPDTGHFFELSPLSEEPMSTALTAVDDFLTSVLPANPQP
jgi:acetyl esterase/lipase